MGNLDKMIGDVIDAVAAGDVSRTVDSMANVVKGGSESLVKTAKEAVSYYADASTGSVDVQKFPRVFTIGSHGINWRDSILIISDNELKYTAEPERRSKSYHIVDDKGYRAAVVSLGKSHIFSNAYDRIGIHAIDKDFYFEVDFSKNGRLLDVEELSIATVNKNVIIVKNGGVEMVRIERKHRSWVIGTASPQFESLAMGLAIAFDLYKKLQ